MVVAFEADHYDRAERRWWTVEVCGVASMVSEPLELAHLRTLPLEPWTTPDTDTFIKIAVTVIGGETVQLGPPVVVDVTEPSVASIR